MTDENYEPAYERLKELYNHTHLAGCELLSQLYNLEKLDKATNKGLQHMSNVVNNVKRQLTALGYNTTSWDLFFISLLQDRLDNVTRKDWKSNRDRENPTLVQLIGIIEKHARALLNSNLQPETDNELEIEDEFIERQSRNTPNNFDGDRKSQTTGKFNCAFCGGRHFTFKCFKYLKRDQKGREDMVKENNLCTNCLGPRHPARFCTAGSCDYCKGKHNKTLCPSIC